MNIYKRKSSGPEQIVGKLIVLNSVAVDGDWRFDNLCGSPKWVVSRQLMALNSGHWPDWMFNYVSRDGSGRLSVKQWCYWLWRLEMSLVRFDPAFVQFNSRLLLVKLSFV